jgi:hypothetical protein
MMVTCVPAMYRLSYRSGSRPGRCLILRPSLVLAVTAVTGGFLLVGCGTAASNSATSTTAASPTAQPIDPFSKEARFLVKLKGFGFRANPGDSDQEIAQLGNDICRALANGHGTDTILPELERRGYGDARRSGNLVGAALR